MTAIHTQHELNSAIVDAVNAHLHATVLNCNTRHHVSIAITKRDDKRVHTVILSVDDQPRKARASNAIVRCVANPVLPRQEVGRVDNEFLGLLVVRGSCLNSTHIAAMSTKPNRKEKKMIRIRINGASIELEATQPNLSHEEAARKVVVGNVRNHLNSININYRVSPNVIRVMLQASTYLGMALRSEVHDSTTYIGAKAQTQ